MLGKHGRLLANFENKVPRDLIKVDTILLWRTIREGRTKLSTPIYLRKKSINPTGPLYGIITITTITTTTTNVKYNVCRINFIQSSCSVESRRCSGLGACWGRFHVGTALH